MIFHRHDWDIMADEWYGDVHFVVKFCPKCGKVRGNATRSFTPELEQKLEGRFKELLKEAEEWMKR